MSLTHAFRSRRALAAAVLASVLIAGCGGGDGSDAVADGQGAISGNAVKGPVSGATVKAFAVAGGLAGPEVGSTVTDADGAFTVPVGQYAGPVLLQMSGGSYLDEATGSVMAMRPGDTMTAVLPAMAAGARLDGIQLTPLTGMAQAMAARTTGGLSEASIAVANGAIGNYFMVDDILRRRPINPLAPGSALGANQSAIHYGMALAGMSQYAKDAGIQFSSALVVALMNDAADGVMDGLSGAATLTILRGLSGGGLPHPDAGRAGLAAAMVGFANSPGNQSGATAAAIAPLTQQLTTLGGRLR